MASKTFIDLTTGLKIPVVGLGTGQLKEETETQEAINTALELGYRHIDTAYSYQNEKFIGRVLHEWFSSGKLKRVEVFITTKLPMPGVQEDRVETFVKRSLENLQLDYVDLYLIHFPIGTRQLEPTGYGNENYKEIDHFDHIAIWKKMEEQVDAGRTKSIGLSNFSQRQIEKILRYARIKPACLQVELHVDLQQRDLVNFCHENGIVVVAYSPLGSPGREPSTPNLHVILHDETIKKVAEKFKKTSAQIMLRYLLQKNVVVIPKSASSKRLKENIDVFDFTLDSEDMDNLQRLEVGESARMYTFKFIPGMEDHPEYPFGT